jgi:hypothetical protein
MLLAQIVEFVPWTRFARIVHRDSGNAGVRTLLDLRGAIPTFIHISDGKLRDVNVLDMLRFEAGACYVMDRGDVDFSRRYARHQAGAFFVTRAKAPMDARRVDSAAADRITGVVCDQQVMLNGDDSARTYPEHLRRIRFRDTESGKTLVFLTHNTARPALTIGALYQGRWQKENTPLGRFSQALPRGLRFAHAFQGRTPVRPSATVLSIRRDPLDYLAHAERARATLPPARSVFAYRAKAVGAKCSGEGAELRGPRRTTQLARPGTAAHSATPNHLLLVRRPGERMRNLDHAGE